MTRLSSGHESAKCAAGLVRTSSPDNLERDLNLARRGRCRGQQTRNPRRRPSGIEYVCIVGGYRHGEVRVIQDIEELCPELHVEIFRHSHDVVVFEYGEIQVRCTRPDHAIASGIAPQIETLRRGANCGTGTKQNIKLWVGAAQRRRRSWKKERGRGRRNRKALGLDVVVGVPWVR